MEDILCRCRKSRSGCQETVRYKSVYCGRDSTGCSLCSLYSCSTPSCKCIRHVRLQGNECGWKCFCNQFASANHQWSRWWVQCDRFLFLCAWHTFTLALYLYRIQILTLPSFTFIAIVIFFIQFQSLRLELDWVLFLQPLWMCYGIVNYACDRSSTRKFVNCDFFVVHFLAALARHSTANVGPLRLVFCTVIPRHWSLRLK